MKNNSGVSIIEYLVAIVLISTLVFMFSSRRLVYLDQVETMNDKNEVLSSSTTAVNYLKKFDRGTLNFYLSFYDYVVINNTNCNFVFNSAFCNNAFYQEINDVTFDNSNFNAYLFWDHQIADVLTYSLPTNVTEAISNLVEIPVVDIIYCVMYVQNGKFDLASPAVIAIE